MEIKNIVFDFGGVLMDWDPRYLFKKVFSNESDLDFFLKNVCNDEWNYQQDAGRPFQEAIQERIQLYPDFKNEIEQYYDNWIEMIGGEISENTALIPKLKSNYRLFGLTNWSAETFPLVYDQYPFFKDLEGIVVSGAEKMAKPDPKIFQLLLNRYKLIANECLFIDDNQENIKTAQSLGFQTIHLTPEVNLALELEKIAVN